MFSSTAGRMIDESATHGIAHSTADRVKPMPSRTTSVFVGMLPSAAAIGSRMSLKADSVFRASAPTTLESAVAGAPESVAATTF